ncbi:MAG: endonuclease/exonuclease/phosphatase family protein [bacterium]|nr:endonuclease/exonuclease/phosphatase family protein [bacterium]
MKLITLNTWGGRAGKTLLLDFFRKYKDVDIFCLQEIWSAPYEHLEGHLAGGRAINHEQIMTNGMQEISELLSNHVSYFCPLLLDNYGLQILVKNNLTIKEDGEVFVYKHKGYVSEEDVGDHGRPIQYVTLNLKDGPITIINFHGAWIKGINKIDTTDRINQSKKIVEFIKNLKNDFILCGDFNLLPDTESIAILERVGLRNLIKEYDITSTRTSFYTKPDKYADYIFVSKGIDAKTFKVLPEEVSDHSALFLEI